MIASQTAGQPFKHRSICVFVTKPPAVLYCFCLQPSHLVCLIQHNRAHTPSDTHATPLSLPLLSLPPLNNTSLALVMAQQHQFLHHRRSAATARHLHSQHSSPLAAAGVAARRQQQQRRTTTRDLTTLAAAGTSQPATTPSGAAASTATEQLRAWVHQHGLPSPAELQPVLVDARG